MENPRYLSSTNSRLILFYSAIEIALFALAFRNIHKDNIMSTIHNIFFIVLIFIMLFSLCYLVTQLCKLPGKNWKRDATQSLKLLFEHTILLIVMAISVIAQIIDRGSSVHLIWEDKIIGCMYLCCFVFIPFMLFTMSKENLKNDISFLNGLDYGTGMAYSFYYGYLRIILPSTGMANKGILEKLENFEDRHNVFVVVKKLFILIPSSSYIPPDLKELSDGWLENSQELEVEIRDRAGIKSRSYHNNIYKIYPGNKRSGVKPEYVAIEGATPILTFFEVQKHFHPESTTYRNHRKQIIKLFYLKLKELISNDPDCKDLCELIYYNDEDSNGIKANVGKIILERIKTLKNEE